MSSTTNSIGTGEAKNGKTWQRTLYNDETKTKHFIRSAAIHTGTQVQREHDHACTPYCCSHMESHRRIIILQIDTIYCNHQMGSPSGASRLNELPYLKNRSRWNASGRHKDFLSRNKQGSRAVLLSSERQESFQTSARNFSTAKKYIGMDAAKLTRLHMAMKMKGNWIFLNRKKEKKIDELRVENRRQKKDYNWWTRRNIRHK